MREDEPDDQLHLLSEDTLLMILHIVHVIHNVHVCCTQQFSRHGMNHATGIYIHVHCTQLTFVWKNSTRSTKHVRDSSQSYVSTVLVQCTCIQRLKAFDLMTS